MALLHLLLTVEVAAAALAHLVLGAQVVQEL